MKKSWKILIGLAIVGAIVAVIVSLYVFRKTDDSVAGKKADYKVTCAEIVSEFEADEQQAGQKYIDKIIEVEGVIAEITTAEESVVVLVREEDSFSGVSCSIGKSQVKDGLPYNVGDNIKVKGICTGYLLDVTLNRGAIVK